MMGFTSFNMRFKSIWRRFAYLIVITSAVFIMLIWIISTQSEKQALKDSIDEELNTILDETAISLIAPLWNYDLNYMEIQADILLKRPTISSITIADNIRGVILDKSDSIGKTNGYIIYYGEKPILKNNVEIGTLKIGVSSLPFEEKSRADFNSRIMMLLMETSIFALLIILISYTITKPLKKLENELIDFADGNYSKVITVTSNDEIGRLSKTFNSMARKIEESNDELKSLNQSLENKLQERTYELRETNEFLKDALSKSQQIQAELTLKNEELENAMEKLQYANRQIIEATKSSLTSQLIAGVAHEIKTPVGLILTTNSFVIHELEEFKDKFENGDIRKSDLTSFLNLLDEASQNISRNLGNTISLISNFKEVAVDQTSQRKRSFNLNYYLSEIISNLKPVFKHTPYIINVNCPLDIIIDSYPGAYSQIITNLIMNSLKHGFGDRDYGTITIDVTTRDDYICIDYKDDGKGISSKYISNIFTPFFSTSHNKGGSGLGLSVIKNLVDKTLQGSITCESDTDKGVHFIIKLPSIIDEVGDNFN